VAKKKPRTPPPPRRVQAPQQRAADDLGMQHRKLLYLISAGGIVALIAVIGVIALNGTSSGKATNDKEVATAMTNAGCTFKTVTAFIPAGQSNHVPSLTAKLPWNTSPPSNGQHYPEWAVWGFYTSPINPRQVVHNEEHGGVILWWGPGVPQSTVDQLKAFYDQEPSGMFGTPYAALGNKFAITAWTGDPAKYRRNNYNGFGHIAKCSTWSSKTEKAFAAFRSAYRGKGPEGIPLSADAPGLGP
jgi:Protein of unknown function (DUF3105)